MNSEADSPSPEEHSRILRQEVLPDHLDSKTSHERPQAILAGGQPGSGKGDQT